MSTEDLAPGIYIGESDIGGGVTIVAEGGECITVPMTIAQMREFASKLQSHAARISKGNPAPANYGEVHV
jgi:hypothetical protein